MCNQLKADREQSDLREGYSAEKARFRAGTSLATPRRSWERSIRPVGLRANCANIATDRQSSIREHPTSNPPTSDELALGAWRGPSTALGLLLPTADRQEC